jgi:hypothetical protein
MQWIVGTAFFNGIAVSVNNEVPWASMPMIETAEHQDALPFNI